MSVTCPLEGVRVLDMCVVLSGPFATMLLADMGAEVIKVESCQYYPNTSKGPTRFSPKALQSLGNTLRGLIDGDPKDRPWERSARVHVVNRNKLSMTVDLTREEGREIFLDLVDHSDVVVENNSPDLLSKLNLGWDVLHARNPRLVLVRMPALAAEGRPALTGVGSNFEAMVGLRAFRGYPDLDPGVQPTTFRMDAASGPAGALAVMAALRTVRKTGEGMQIVLSQTTNLLHHAADVMVAAQVTGKEPVPAFNSHPRMAPHGCYPVSGEDRWVVIACRDNGDWQHLVAVMGDPEWAADDDFADVAGRLRRAAELDEHVSAWTASQDGGALEEVLLAAGIPSSRVLRESEKMNHAHYADRDWFLTMSHPEAGSRTYPGHLWHSSAGPLQSHRSAPVLGEDNDHVYREVLGYDEPRIAELRRQRHIGKHYDFEDK